MGMFNNKPKKTKANGAYKAQRLNARRKVALNNLKKRAAMSDEEIHKMAKRFRNVDRDPESGKKELKSYRIYLEKEIDKLEKLIT